jgi:transketolase
VGDLVGQAVEGTLYYLPYAEFERIRGLDVPPEHRASMFADMCRLNALYMIACAGSGHIGSSFSSLDIVSWLLLEEMDEGDVYFSSKGHDAPGFYAALIGTGRLDFALTHRLRRIDGLPGHPDVGTPGIATNTGSLGMGVSKAKGMILANRVLGRSGRVFVMTGDGELQEGQFWESLVSAVNFDLNELVVVIDHNKLQSDTFVKNVSDLGDLEAKLEAFGWYVARCDGHNLSAFARTLKTCEVDPRPKVIIADTVKGRGVSFMEHTALDSDVAMYRFHSGAPEAGAYRRAAQELIDRLQQRIEAMAASSFVFEKVVRDVPVQPAAEPQRLVAAYSRALIEQADRHPNLVALDADLILDTGLIPFREKHPDRLVECGIAEQDMVSMAGGMALNGLMPVVHSFACFLSARPNEQIYNNATEETRILYVGSLAGVVPGGPGHSHQAVRDISTLAAVPGMILVEPSCEAEVNMLLDWCVNEAPGSSYLRLVSLPWNVPFALPEGYRPVPGRGVCIHEGRDVAIVAYGPVLLSEAVNAARRLANENGPSVKVINLPWLNQVDTEWLQGELAGCGKVFCLDNHYAIGGQADMILSALAVGKGVSPDVDFIRVGVESVPPSGSVAEVLRACGLDADSLITRVRQGR